MYEDKRQNGNMFIEILDTVGALNYKISRFISHWKLILPSARERTCKSSVYMLAYTQRFVREYDG